MVDRVFDLNQMLRERLLADIARTLGRVLGALVIACLFGSRSAFTSATAKACTR